MLRGPEQAAEGRRDEAMELPKNRFKQAIADGGLQIGLWSQLVGATPAEVLAGAGYDFVVIDAGYVYVAVGSDLGVLANQTAALAARFPQAETVGAPVSP